MSSKSSTLKTLASSTSIQTVPSSLFWEENKTSYMSNFNKEQEYLEASCASALHTSANLDQLKDLRGLDGWGMFFFFSDDPRGAPGGGGIPPMGGSPGGGGGPPGGGGGGGGGGIIPPGGGGGGGAIPAKPGWGTGPPGGPGATGGPPGTTAACLCRDTWEHKRGSILMERVLLHIQWNCNYKKKCYAFFQHKPYHTDS